MADQSLVTYIQQAREAGMTDGQIKQELLSAGWQENLLTEAFAVGGGVSAPVSPTTTAATKFSWKKPWLIGLVILVILGVGGAGAAYYYSVNYPSLDRLMQNYLTGITHATSFDYAFSLESENRGDLSALAMVAKPKPGEPLKLSLKFHGTYDQTVATDKKISSTLDLSAADFNIQAEVRYLANTLYLRFANLPNLGIVDFSHFSNQWVKLENVIKSADQPKDQAAALPQLSAAQIDQLTRLWQSAKLVSLSERLPQVALSDGTMTHHLRLTLDKTALRGLILASYQVINKQELPSEELQSLDNFIATTNFENIELWFGKKDQLLHRLALTISIKGDEGVPGETTKVDSTNQITLEFSGFNTPKNITAPADAKTFEQIMSESLGAPATTPTPLPSNRPTSLKPTSTSIPPDLWFSARGLIYSLFGR